MERHPVKIGGMYETVRTMIWLASVKLELASKCLGIFPLALAYKRGIEIIEMLIRGFHILSCIVWCSGAQAFGPAGQMSSVGLVWRPDGVLHSGIQRCS